MKNRLVGYWRTLIGYPDISDKIPCFGCRWQFLPMVRRTMFQVKVESFGEYVWINIPQSDFERLPD